MRAAILVLVVCVFFLGCEGPTGPAGKDGKDGKDLNIDILSGILTSGSLVDAKGWFSTDYWIIKTNRNLENSIVSVFVRKGSGFVWERPSFYFSASYIYLYYTGDVRPGWEYRIIIAN